jgi:hypothetical protein
MSAASPYQAHPCIASSRQATEPGTVQDHREEQYLLVRLDEDRAINALPALLGPDAMGRKAALNILHRILDARGDISAEGKRRLTRVETMFGVTPGRTIKAEAAHA